MYEEFVARRLADLRTQKGISARDMSLSIGQSESYINKIENGRALPSLSGLFYICEYLGVSPKDFFDESYSAPAGGGELLNAIKRLDSEQTALILALVKNMR